MEYSSADFFNNVIPTLAIVLPDLFPFTDKIQMQLGQNSNAIVALILGQRSLRGIS
jgi:hypothetical protein